MRKQLSSTSNRKDNISVKTGATDRSGSGGSDGEGGSPNSGKRSFYKNKNQKIEEDVYQMQ